ncbi:MAG: hypothetical protein J6A76_02045 [Oscillospiraceae bacterium]|nr:hypothetical protein [Oscillospiraceae bacterium]
MIKRILAAVLAVMMLAACSGNPGSTQQAAASSQGKFDNIIPEEDTVSDTGSRDIVKDGKICFAPIENATFTMDYEPRQGSVTNAHFGLNFVKPVDTNWLGDNGLDAMFDIHEYTDNKVYGSVKITTAPADLAAHFGTSDEKLIAEKMKADFFTAENYYNGYRKNVAEDFGYEIVKEGYGEAFEGGWNAFYVEFIDKESNNCGMRFYLCNDEINEKFYSMMIQVDVPADDAERINKYRGIIFTLHPME